ncbi:unnamed protein product, partial [Coccothraustes coccothraustes]
MHGLSFETSICYWQDQPGRGRGTGRRHLGRAVGPRGSRARRPGKAPAASGPGRRPPRRTGGPKARPPSGPRLRA